MDVSISIVSWNTCELLDNCIKSIFESVVGIYYEIIVVDNRSGDCSAEMIKSKYPSVKLIKNSENVGFAKANNQAFNVSLGKYFLILNPDIICSKETIVPLVNFLDKNSKAAVVGPEVLNCDGSIQHSWAKFPTLVSELKGKLDRRIETDNNSKYFQTDWIGGCCMLVRRTALEEIGLMDENIFMYSEETDLCYRLKKNGWQIWVNMDAKVVHLGGKSSDQNFDAASKSLISSKLYFFDKHYGFFAKQMLFVIYFLRKTVKSILGK